MANAARNYINPLVAGSNPASPAIFQGCSSVGRAANVSPFLCRYDFLPRLAASPHRSLTHAFGSGECRRNYIRLRCPFGRAGENPAPAKAGWRKIDASEAALCSVVSPLLSPRPSPFHKWRMPLGIHWQPVSSNLTPPVIAQAERAENSQSSSPPFVIPFPRRAECRHGLHLDRAPARAGGPDFNIRFRTHCGIAQANVLPPVVGTPAEASHLGFRDECRAELHYSVCRRFESCQPCSNQGCSSVGRATKCFANPTCRDESLERPAVASDALDCGGRA